MSSSRIGLQCGRLLIGALALSLALVFGLAPAIAADAHSSPEDRARFVSITRKLEEAPLQPGAREDRAWALSWLTDAPDVSVNVCSSLGGLVKSKYPYAGEIVLQYTFAMAALVIEHPETTNDSNAQQLAGVTGALKAYRSILRGKPDAKSPALDSLLEIEARGELPDYIQKESARCSAKK
jgi:hypothetical protein